MNFIAFCQRNKFYCIISVLQKGVTLLTSVLLGPTVQQKRERISFCLTVGRTHNYLSLEPITLLVGVLLKEITEWQSPKCHTPDVSHSWHFGHLIGHKKFLRRDRATIFSEDIDMCNTHKLIFSVCLLSTTKQRYSKKTKKFWWCHFFENWPYLGFDLI